MNFLGQMDLVDGQGGKWPCDLKRAEAVLGAPILVQMRAFLQMLKVGGTLNAAIASC
jgi:hypothetical protein